MSEKVREDLAKYKYHPRIMEIRLALIRSVLIRQYGDEIATEILKNLSIMFGCNWAVLVGVFQKGNRILNHPAVDTNRKRQEVIFMGYLYEESRLMVARQYLNMSANYLYQDKTKHNAEVFATQDWLDLLQEEAVVCGVRSYATETKRFLLHFDSFISVFTPKP